MLSFAFPEAGGGPPLWRSTCALRLASHLAPLRGAILGFAIASTLGCGDRPGGSLGVGAPSLVPLPPVLIHEPEGQVIGNSVFLARSGTGDLYLTDVERQSVLRFSSSGSYLGRFGRSGSGPGEFQLPTVASVLDDSLLVVADVALSRLSIFSIPSQDFRRSVSLPVPDIGQTFNYMGGDVYFAAHLAVPSVVGWRLADDSVWTLGATPASILARPEAAVRHGRSDVVVSRNRLLVLTPTANGLRILNLSGALLGTVRIPATRRRGTPDDLIERQLAQHRKGGRLRFQPVGSSSVMLGALPTGEIVIVYLDVDLVASGPRNRFSHFRYYVTVLKEDMETACIDALVQTDADLISLPVMSEGVLYLFLRTVLPNDSVEAKVAGYRIALDHCRWVTTGGMRPPADP